MDHFLAQEWREVEKCSETSQQQEKGNRVDEGISASKKQASVVCLKGVAIKQASWS